MKADFADDIWRKPVYRLLNCTTERHNRGELSPTALALVDWHFDGTAFEPKVPVLRQVWIVSI